MNAAFPLEYSGAGIWEILYFSALFESEGGMYLLDEPAANVHPNLQKLVFDKWFKEKMKSNTNPSGTSEGQGNEQKKQPQIFLITHSPYLINLDHIKNISRFDIDQEDTIRKYVKGDKLRINSKEILSRSKAAVECLFSKVVIMVEGPSEYIALPMWFKKCLKFSLEDKNIQLIWIGGVGFFQHYLEFLERFKIPWFF